eukprot:GEMP01119148.1.p1 GENE.GEMP01119148.1~~GEMP01119148.1.p1  ORF type:complete len:128 (+),score=7.02 GEMP01119148.1:162-545(+)
MKKQFVALFVFEHHYVSTPSKNNQYEQEYIKRCVPHRIWWAIVFLLLDKKDTQTQRKKKKTCEFWFRKRNLEFTAIFFAPNKKQTPYLKMRKKYGDTKKPLLSFFALRGDIFECVHKSMDFFFLRKE